MSDAQTTPHLPPVTSDTSQPPQEITPPRLPTPSQQKFCEPCKAFLRGDSTECFGSDKWKSWPEHEYMHHPDAESFQRALDLPCVICIRLYKAFQSASEKMDQSAYSTGPTHYNWDELQELCFLSDTLSVNPCVERYESRPYLHHQHMTPSTGDAQALSFLRKQYQECREQHSRCQRIASYNDFTPTRAMYVGSTGDEIIRLCDRADMVAGASYTVLSHCWGKDPQRVMLKKSTEQMLKEGIPSSSLPKTFQDAIVVTRMFEIQYIWIDSLCIFQDNLDDWAAEASRMRDVYSKAELCIAATGAESGDVGLFLDRDPEQLTPVMVEATWSSNQDSFHWPTSGSYLFGFYAIDADKAVDSAPLNQRAWVAQERFLSTRILHFTQPLLFWGCHESFTQENHASSNTKPRSALNDLRSLASGVQWSEHSDNPIQTTTLHSISKDIRLSAVRDVYSAWGRFLTSYTRCGITKESDILVALVGIADEVGHTMDDCLVAGLWKACFITELCWKSGGKTSRPSVWRAPSWSWASLSGRTLPPSYLANFTVTDIAAIIEFYISTKPSGEVEPGSVLLECRLIPASIHRGGSIHHNPFTEIFATLDQSVRASLPRKFHLGIKKRIDVFLDVGDASCYQGDQRVDVQLLPLRISKYKNTRFWFSIGICVVNSGNWVGAYERIGYFRAENDAAESLLAAYDQAWVQAIPLV